jgi:hypothetical protein
MVESSRIRAEDAEKEATWFDMAAVGEWPFVLFESTSALFEWRLTLREPATALKELGFMPCAWTATL